MKRYIKIFWIIFTSYLSREFNMGWNAIVRLFGSICFFFMHIISLQFLLSKFSFVGWNNREMWVLLMTFEIFTYLSFLLLWRGLTQTLQDINRGGLDTLLIKPINIRFSAFSRGGGIQNLLTMLFSIGWLIWVSTSFNLQINIFNVLIYAVIILSSVWMLHCLSLIIFSLNLIVGYTPGSDSLIFQIQEVYKYPATTYAHMPIWIKALIIPLALFTTIPTAIFLGKYLNPNLFLIYLLFLALSTVLSEFIWQKSLRYYSSASS